MDGNCISIFYTFLRKGINNEYTIFSIKSRQNVIIKINFWHRLIYPNEISASLSFRDVISHQAKDKTSTNNSIFDKGTNDDVNAFKKFKICAIVKDKIKREFRFKKKMCQSLFYSSTYIPLWSLSLLLCSNRMNL